jgi:uncharacterized membrane protein YgcG
MMRAMCLALVAVLAFVAMPAFAQDLQAVPPLNARVTDLTGTLTAQQQSAMEQKLAEFEARKGSQLAVLIVPTTEPEDIAQYSIRVVEQWKLGREKVDDGALLIVAKNDRRLRIEVGQGLEGVLTDATSRRIISNTIAPLFRQGDFAGGINAGLDRIIRTIDGEPLPPPDRRWRARASPRLAMRCPSCSSAPSSGPASFGACWVAGLVLWLPAASLAGWSGCSRTSSGSAFSLASSLSSSPCWRVLSAAAAGAAGRVRAPAPAVTAASVGWAALEDWAAAEDTVVGTAAAAGAAASGEAAGLAAADSAQWRRRLGQLVRITRS